MKLLQLAEAKTHFSSVIKDVEKGHEITITYGKKKQAVAVIIPYEKWRKTKKRKLGTLESKMSVLFSKNFETADEELINL